MKIRAARVSDAMKIHELVEYYADNKEMLHRSLNAIYENIQDFVVVEDKGDIVGCGALHVAWSDLAEIKALAVEETYKGRGIGRKIVEKLQSNAVDLDVYRVFALSFKPNFFKKLGYKIISKETLPHKIWGECVNCHLFPDCGEVPLLISLNKKNLPRKNNAK